MQPQPTTAAIYVRVSSAGQEDNYSLGSQEQACHEYATAHGYDAGPVYREIHTGVELWQRPQLTALREAIRRVEVAAVIVYAIDRLARDPVHLGVVLSEAEHAGVAVLFVTEPLDDSPEGQLIRFVRGYAGKVEHLKFKDRSRRGKLGRVAAGKMLAGPRPLYGYRWDEPKDQLIADDATAPIVRRIYGEALRGRPLRAIAQGLADDGIPSPTGNPSWLHTAIQRILSNPAYAGRPVALRRAGAKKGTPAIGAPVDLPEGAVEPLVDGDTFAAVQHRLTLNKQRATRNNHDPEGALLRGGIARCAYCGRSLTVVRMKWGSIYRCINPTTKPEPCRNHSIVVHALDARIWDGVTAILTEEDRIERDLALLRADDPTVADLAAVDRAIVECDRKIGNLADTIATNDSAAVRATLAARVSQLEEERGGLLRERETIAARRQEWEQAQHQLASVQEWCKAMAEELPTLDYAGKRRVLETLRVEVRLWRNDVTPRWVATARIPLERPIVFDSSCGASGTCATRRAWRRTRR
jgi:site-specific DNA recombinase